MTYSANNPSGIDLRKEFAEIMKNHGWWGLVRKPVDHRKVAAFNEQTQESEVLRDLAMGRGYHDQWVRFRRMTLFDVPESPSSAGREAVPLVRFYLQSKVKPDVHDFLCEVALDEESMCRGSQIQPIQPVDIVKFWDINEVTPMREFGGRIEFWQVFVTEVVMGDLG
jgi:hypothetical protein